MDNPYQVIHLKTVLGYTKEIIWIFLCWDQ